MKCGFWLARVLVVVALGIAFAACAQAGNGAVGGGGGGRHDLAGGGGGNDDLGPGGNDDLGGGGGDQGGGGGDLAPVNCDLVAQTGCQTGLKCTVGAMDAKQCVVDGDKGTGQACGAAQADDCVRGNLCTAENMAGTATQCRQFCTVDTDCKQPAAPGGATNVGHCVVTYQNSMIKACSVPCNPVLAAGKSGCAAGLACGVFALATAQATDCALAGTGTNGTDCTKNGNSDCAQGFACVTITDANMNKTTVCKQVCRVGQTPDCAGQAGTACQAPTGGTGVLFGFCI